MIFSILLFLFIALPIAELALLLKVNDYLHLGGTLALVIGIVRDDCHQNAAANWIE